MRGKIVIATIVIVCILLGLFHANYLINIEYTYNKTIGSYLANAYDASTFELMKENYVKAKQGMIDQGLEPTDYGKWFNWEQTPDWQMNYTYRYIDGLIARCDYYITVTTTGSISPFTDVYNQMITNMRNESIRNGPVDWTVWPAWEIKNAPIYYWGLFFWIFGIIVAIIAVIFAFFVGEGRWIDSL